MRVTARNGRCAFLVDLGEGHAVVLDIEGAPTLSQPSSRASILGGAYWEPFVGDERAVLDVVTQVALEGEDLPRVGWVRARAARRFNRK
jgi:hypothetical protein